MTNKVVEGFQLTSITHMVNKYVIVKTYLRNSANPYPGRLVEVKKVKMSAAECAWLDYVHACWAARDARELEWETRSASQFEALADSAADS